MMLDPKSQRMIHPIYNLADIEKVGQTHHTPQGFSDYFAYYFVKTCRKIFERASFYNESKMNESKYLFRFILLETVAGIPGFVAGMCRHLRSLRVMEQDKGWIHQYLEEAENERMHLFIFLQIKKPELFSGHRAIGYLEEEAVKTYTRCLEDLDAGKITSWSSLNANALAIDYWNLPKDAMFRDVLLAVRADECIHREVNHHFTNIGKDDQIENGMLYIMDKNKNNE